MGKVTIGPANQLNPIVLIGPGLLDNKPSIEQTLNPQVVEKLIETFKEVPIEILKTVEVIKYVDKIVEVQVPSEPIIIEKIIEIPKIEYIEKEVIKMEKYDDSQLKKELNNLYLKCMKLEERINLIKLFVPIALGIAAIGLFI